MPKLPEDHPAVQYPDFKNPHAKAERPYNPPTRALNSALHGAGSKVEGAQYAQPLRKPQYNEHGAMHRSSRQSDPATRLPSEASERWLRDILTKRQLPPKGELTGAQRAAAALKLLDAGAMSQAQVSKAIDAFKDCPRKVEQLVEQYADADLTSMTDEQRVVAYLEARFAAGTINEFGASLLGQYRARGRLSDRQIEVMLRGMPSEPTKGPEKASPATEEARMPSPQALPAGRYAVESKDGELTFYRIKRGKQNPRYVEIYLKHGPSESKVPYTVPGYARIMWSIVEAGAGACAIRYGRELGCCSVCAADLTNRLSRELGIGPVCGGHYYEDPREWKKIKADARAAIRARGEDPDEVVA